MFLGHQHLLLPGADFAGIDGVDVVKGALSGVPAVHGRASGAAISASSISRWSETRPAGASPTRALRRAPIYRRDDDGVVAAIVASDAEGARRRASRARGDARLRARAGRRRRLADPFLFRADRRRSRRCRSSTPRRAGTSRRLVADAAGARRPADSVRGRAVQMRRPRRAGLLHRRRGGPDRDQGRRRHLSLSQQPARR